MFLVCFISFVLDGIVTRLIGNNSLLYPLCSIVSLILIYPYIRDKKKFFCYIIIVGVLYDIVYTQTPFLNTFAFLLLGCIIYLFYKFLPINIINSLLLLTFLILFYRAFVFFSFFLILNQHLEYSNLLISFYRSLIFNYIYWFVFNIILKIVMKKYEVKKRQTPTF